MPRDHILAALGAIPFEELLKYKMVMYKDPCDIRTSFRRSCNILGKQPIMGIELEFNDSVLSFVAQNHGISIVPEMMAKAIQGPQVIVKPIISAMPFVRTVDRVALDNKWLALN